MGYEPRIQAVEPKRSTCQHLTSRFGDKPATRYREGAFSIRAMQDFDYRLYRDPGDEPCDPQYAFRRRGVVRS